MFTLCECEPSGAALKRLLAAWRLAVHRAGRDAVAGSSAHVRVSAHSPGQVNIAELCVSRLLRRAMRRQAINLYLTRYAAAARAGTSDNPTIVPSPQCVNGPACGISQRFHAI